jgi:hypothetical protein
MGALKDTIELYNDRLEAIGMTDYEGRVVSEDETRALLIGTDIDADEIAEVAARISYAVFTQGLEDNQPFATIMAGMWFHGAMIGALHVMRLRDQTDGPST